MRRWRFDALNVPGKPELFDKPIAQIWSPASRRDQELLRLWPGCPPTRRSKHVGPHVEHRQQIVAAPGIGHRNDYWLLADIEPSRRIQRIEIWPHHTLEIGWWIFGYIAE